MSRDYEKHYRELSEKLNRNIEDDMHKIAEWYIDNKELDFTHVEHLNILELLGFERQVSFDEEFRLDEADYVSQSSIKFNSWFKKRWEFLNEYYKIMQSASNSFVDATSMLKDIEWNSKFNAETAEARAATIHINGAFSLYKYLDRVLEECDNYSTNEKAAIFTEEEFNNWSEAICIGYGRINIEVKGNTVYLICENGDRHTMGYKKTEEL